LQISFVILEMIGGPFNMVNRDTPQLSF